MSRRSSAPSLQVRTYPAELLASRSEGEDDGGSIAGLVVPYETPAEVGGQESGIWEVIDRGALVRSIEQRGHLIELHPGHGPGIDGGMPVGMATRWEHRAEGLWGEFRLARTTAGNDARELVRSGMVRGLSVSFAPVRSTLEHRDGKVIQRQLEAAVHHVALTTKPAYPTAVVAEVRALPEGWRIELARQWSSIGADLLG